MALYTFKCGKCGRIMDKIFPMKDCPCKIECIHCRGEAEKILSATSIQTDAKVSWLPSACEVLQRHGERPLETRTEYKKYLKDNGLIPGA